MHQIENELPAEVIEAAHHLPDDGFLDHPAIAALQAVMDQARETTHRTHASWEVRYSRAGVVSDRIEALQAAEEEVRSGFRGLAAADLARGDLEFTAATDGRARCQFLTWQIEAAQDALQVLEAEAESLEREFEAASEAYERAHAQLRHTLWGLKLKAVRRARGMG
jgi:chromosome segregation ATPase